MYVKAVYHMTEITMSLQRRIILLGKTLYFERRSVHCCVPCCGVLFKTNLRESEWSCWRFSSYCARKYVTIVWFFCFNCLKGKKCKRVSFSLWHRTHETWWRHLIKLAHYNRSQECHCFCTTRNRNVSTNFKRHIQCWSLWSTTSMQRQVTFEDEGPWIHQVNGYFISYFIILLVRFLISSRLSNKAHVELRPASMQRARYKE